MNLVEDIDDGWLTRFSGPLAPMRELVARLRDGTERPLAGGVALCHRPHVAPQWFSAKLWTPLAREVWRRHEALHEYTIDERYAQVLDQVNGARLFGLSLYGMPPSLLRPKPTLDRSAASPLDLGQANRHWSATFNPPEHWFHFGSATWTRSENIGYFLDEAGAVHGLLPPGREVRSWPGLTEWFASELSRVEALEPERETAFARTLAESQAKRGWLRRWLGR